MMWGDMLLGYGEASDYANAPPEDARWARGQLPKDIVVADWHYQGDLPDFPSLEVLEKDGFQTIAAPWCDPRNIRDFAKAADRAHAMGLLQTTWAGYALSPEVLEGSSFHQFAMYLLAAEQAWNGGSVEPLDYDPLLAFLAFWQDADRHREDADDASTATVHSQLRPGFTVLLPGPQTASDPSGPGAPAPSASSSAPSAREQWNENVVVMRGFGGVVFATGPLLMISPEGLTVSCGNRTAKKICLLWARVPSPTVMAPGVKVTFLYGDGTQESKDGQIGLVNESFSHESLPRVWHGRLGQFTDAWLHRWDAFNPHPERPIRAVNITPAEGRLVILAGVSGVTQ
jgi:hypothetical protein